MENQKEQAAEQKNNKAANAGKTKGTDLIHKELVPEVPKPVINPPNEATDPNELLNRA